MSKTLPWATQCLRSWRMRSELLRRGWGRHYNMQGEALIFIKSCWSLVTSSYHQEQKRSVLQAEDLLIWGKVLRFQGFVRSLRHGFLTWITGIHFLLTEMVKSESSEILVHMSKHNGPAGSREVRGGRGRLYGTPQLPPLPAVPSEYPWVKAKCFNHNKCLTGGPVIAASFFRHISYLLISLHQSDPNAPLNLVEWVLAPLGRIHGLFTGLHNEVPQDLATKRCHTEKKVKKIISVPDTWLPLLPLWPCSCQCMIAVPSRKECRNPTLALTSSRDRRTSRGRICTGPASNANRPTISGTRALVFQFQVHDSREFQQ